jgi:GGDEF domain-containing protein
MPAVWPPSRGVLQLRTTMPENVDDVLAARIVAAVPWVQQREAPSKRFLAALEWLVEQEEYRRGAPEAFSGALTPTALMQGAVLKREFDLSVHAHTGWNAGAVIVDVKELIEVNKSWGFSGGDRVLRELSAHLRGAFPREQTVRMHGDCYAVLFLPSSGEEVTSAVAASGLSTNLAYTLSALRLRVFDPSHWQVLGPLLVAEIERAHVMARRGLASGIQERELRLDGRVPTLPG